MSVTREQVVASLPEFILAREGEMRAAARGASPERLWAMSQADRTIINDAGFMQEITPARVLRQCEAFRRIVERHHPDRHLENWYWPERKCAECGGLWHKLLPNAMPTEIGPEQGCATLRAIAEIWSDHEDFRQEWAS